MSDELWVLDRFEDGGRAVLVSTSEEVRTVPRRSLPPEAREGEAFRERAGKPVDGELRFEPDPEATAELKERAVRLRSSLREGPAGPISL